MRRERRGKHEKKKSTENVRGEGRRTRNVRKERKSTGSVRGKAGEDGKGK